MSFVTRQAAHCDQCSHEWLVVGASTPTHCAKCKSRRWNSKPSMNDCVVVDRPDSRTYCVRSQVDPEDIKYVRDDYSQA